MNNSLLDGRAHTFNFTQPIPIHQTSKNRQQRRGGDFGLNKTISNPKTSKKKDDYSLE